MRNILLSVSLFLNLLTCGPVKVSEYTICYDAAVLYTLADSVIVSELYGKPDAATLAMLNSGDYGIAVSTICNDQ